MTATVTTTPGLASRLVNGLLSIKPLANLARHQARTMMIKRAEKIGVYWHDEVKKLRSQDLEAELKAIQNPHLTYPDYYLRSFHAYDDGNLGWEPATEVEVAAYAVHAGIWPEAGAKGDGRLRQTYHDVLKSKLSIQPQDILDLACSVGMSTLALQKTYPQAKLTGVDLSPYFLAIAQLRSRQQQLAINWIHSSAESINLPTASFDLVSAFLLFHELPQSAAREILTEIRRLLRPNGYLTIMDMNPQSEVYRKMPPYILTLLKSTEPYLDEYFTFDLEQELPAAGFQAPTISYNSHRHRTIIAQVN